MTVGVQRTARRRWRRRTGWVLLGVVIGALLLGLVLSVPRLLFPPLKASALRGVAPDRRIELETNRLKLQSDTRASLLQGLAGLAVLAGVAVAWQQLRHTIQAARAQHDLDRSEQITERFTRAVDQLGRQEQLEVVLGGIYALERIARDSAEDRAVIAEVLTAYIRAHASWPPPPSSAYGPDTPLNELPTLQARSPDVQAVATVLGRGDFPQAVAGHLGLTRPDYLMRITNRLDLARVSGFGD